MIIITSKCESCKNCELRDKVVDQKTNRKVMVIHCSAREKEYYYGAKIDCDDFDLKEGSKNPTKRHRRTKAEMNAAKGIDSNNLNNTPDSE